MPIIDFLLNNIVFVIVAIGMLFSFLSKLKGAENQPKRPKHSMPPFGGDTSGWPLPRDIAPMPPRRSVEPERRPAAERDARGGTLQPAAQAQDDGQYAAAAPLSGNRAAAEDGEGAAAGGFTAYEPPASSPLPAANRTGPAAATKQQAAAVPSPLSPERPDAAAIVRGVVWSEILGPPRAKKPFRR